MNELFLFLSFSPGPFWLGLMFFPQKPAFQKVFDAYLWLLLGVFAVRALPTVPTLVPLLSNPTFDAMHAIFRTPEGFLSGWNHFIIGDLWFGRYIAADSAAQRLPAAVRVVSVLLTLCSHGTCL